MPPADPLRLSLNQLLILRLRPKGPDLACMGLLFANPELVRAMAYGMYGALIASLGVAAVILAPNETFADPVATYTGGSVSARPAFRPPTGRPLPRHRGHNARTFWPAGAAGYFYEPPYAEPGVNVAPPASGDIRYTYTYDVPWDWSHRYPPAVAPSDRPYVQECTKQTVKVPRREGSEETVSVNITRCY